MMLPGNSARAVVLLVAGAAAGAMACGSPATGETSETGDNLTSDRFAATLRCDGDAAVLDTSTTTHRSLDLSSGVETVARAVQFVVRDRKVVDHISSKVNHLVNGRREVIVKGSLLDGRPFDSFEDWSIGTASSRSEGNRVRVTEQTVAVVHRVRGEPGRIRLAFNRTTQRMSCSTHFEETHCARDVQHNAPGVLRVERSDEPIADWVFNCATP